jgi:HEAT repeat protein
MRRRLPASFAVVAFAAFLLSACVSIAAQDARDPVTPEQLRAAIDKLGAIDFPVRMSAGRTVRRAPSTLAVPALTQAVEGHTDGYVRFRALVLLAGFNDQRTRSLMGDALGDVNDRLRTVAYSYFEHNPDPAIRPRLLEALKKEESEFVRPALTRALAAYGADPVVRQTMTQLVLSGHDFFRSEVIQALGDYKATYALNAITEVAKLEGPLQDDAILAIGKVGEKRSLETLAALQRSAPRAVQPAIAAAICLVGSNCDAHERYLVESLRFAIGNIGYQELLRSAAKGLAALAVAGRERSAAVLIELGAPTRDPARAAVALALGTIALRNTPLMLKVLEGQHDLEPAMDLLGEAFDMLEEDFQEERFFVAVRRGYWQAAEGSVTRKVADALIQKLEF